MQHHARATALRAQASALEQQATALRQEADALEAEAKPAAAPEPLYLRVADYARRVAMSERTIWTLVSRGLPCIGSGRSRRVDVRRADGWMREQRDHVDDAVEKRARAAARMAARRIG